MADFNQLLGKAKAFANSAADTVSDVASDLYEKGKDKVEEAKLRSSLRDAYRVLGEMTYNKAKGVEVDESRMDVIVADIDNLLSALANIAE